MDKASTAIVGIGDEQADELVSLVDDARHGDSTAISAIYQHFGERIYRYALFKLGDSQQAEDVCAQVFLKMVESIARFKWQRSSGGSRVNPSSFSAWLYRIAHNLITDHWRREARRPTVSLDSIAQYLTADGDPHHAAEEAIFREQLTKALDSLTDLQARVIALKFGSELTNTEVAQILGRSEGAVKALQYSALQKLNRLLGPSTNK